MANDIYPRPVYLKKYTLINRDKHVLADVYGPRLISEELTIPLRFLKNAQGSTPP